MGYIRPMVLLEPGTHAELIPRGSYAIRPFAAKHFAHVFAEPDCPVEAITAERTFWEKVTILHAEYYRPTAGAIQGRHSRHYYDTAMLAKSPIKAKALADVELMQRVVRHKMEFYYSKWARYDLAAPGTLRLLPPNDRVPEIRRDYESMKVMVFGEAPTIDAIMETLGALEAEINAR